MKIWLENLNAFYLCIIWNVNNKTKYNWVSLKKFFSGAVNVDFIFMVHIVFGLHFLLSFSFSCNEYNIAFQYIWICLHSLRKIHVVDLMQLAIETVNGNWWASAKTKQNFSTTIQYTVHNTHTRNIHWVENYFVISLLLR